jgi:hypothetical protein
MARHLGFGQGWRKINLRLCGHMAMQACGGNMHVSGELTQFYALIQPMRVLRGTVSPMSRFGCEVKEE